MDVFDELWNLARLLVAAGLMVVVSKLGRWL